MIIAWCIAIILLLAVAGLAVHALMKDRAKRKRLAATYDDADRMFRIQRGPSAAPAPIPPAPIVQRARAREPETAADEWPGFHPQPEIDPEQDW